MMGTWRALLLLGTVVSGTMKATTTVEIGYESYIKGFHRGGVVVGGDHRDFSFTLVFVDARSPLYLSWPVPHPSTITSQGENATTVVMTLSTQMDSRVVSYGHVFTVVMTESGPVLTVI